MNSLKDFEWIIYKTCKHCNHSEGEESILLCEVCHSKLMNYHISILGADELDVSAEGEDNPFTCDICKYTQN